MLPKELLEVKKRGSRITPRFADLRQYQSLAEKIIKIFKESIGKTQETIDKRLEEVEKWKTYKKVRGFGELLKRRCSFEQESPRPPERIRRGLYERGFVTNPEKRAQIIGKVAKELNISPETVKKSFWADLDKHQILVDFHPLPPERLLRKYNLALTQTLLFDAQSLTIKVSGNYQEIFRLIKLFGLMYKVQNGEELRVEISGPTGLFRKTRKYGTKIAKLLPTISQTEEWQLKAEIIREAREGPRSYLFKLDSSNKSLLEVEATETEKFDSLVEEDFAKKIHGTAKDWNVKREPTFLRAGKRIVIPDFLLEKQGIKRYVEIVGFWTQEYLKHKLEKLEKIEEPILLFVDKSLKCTKEDFGEQPENVIFYERQISTRKILSKLRAIEAEQQKKEARKLQMSDISLKNGKKVEEIAKEQKISTQVVESKIRQKLEDTEEWYLVSGRITHEMALRKLKKQISKLPKKTLTKVNELLEETGFDLDVLRKIGYKVEWKGLDPQQARIEKCTTS